MIVGDLYRVRVRLGLGYLKECSITDCLIPYRVRVRVKVGQGQCWGWLGEGVFNK